MLCVHQEEERTLPGSVGGCGILHKDILHEYPNLAPGPSSSAVYSGTSKLRVDHEEETVCLVTSVIVALHAKIFHFGPKMSHLAHLAAPVVVGLRNYVQCMGNTMRSAVNIIALVVVPL